MGSWFLHKAGDGQRVVLNFWNNVATKPDNRHNTIMMEGAYRPRGSYSLGPAAWGFGTVHAPLRVYVWCCVTLNYWDLLPFKKCLLIELHTLYWGAIIKRIKKNPLAHGPFRARNILKRLAVVGYEWLYVSARQLSLEVVAMRIEMDTSSDSTESQVSMKSTDVGGTLANPSNEVMIPPNS